MNLRDEDLSIERIRGRGPGGQHRNKTASCVRITHLPTGIVVQSDTRCQHTSLRKAKKALVKAIKAAEKREKQEAAKADRDERIKNETVRRTYDARRNKVRDHRSGRTTTFKQMMTGKSLQDFLEDDLWADL